MFFQMFCSWHRWWGIPVESNVPQVGLALVTLVTSLLWHGAHFCWRAHATGPAQLFLPSLDALIAKSTFLVLAFASLIRDEGDCKTSMANHPQNCLPVPFPALGKVASLLRGKRDSSTTRKSMTATGEGFRRVAGL